MTKFGDLFEEVTRPSHPKIRYWMSQKGEHDAYVTIKTKLAMATPSPHKIYFHVIVNNNDQTEEIFNDMDTWSIELNHQLVERGIRASDHKNEMVRFGFMLANQIDSIDFDYGSGYVNTLLISYFKDHIAFRSNIPNLKKVETSKPYINHKSYNQCLDDIKYIIKNNATLLNTKLAYTEEESAKILADSLNLLIDIRYAILRCEYKLLIRSERCGESIGDASPISPCQDFAASTHGVVSNREALGFK
jgi:hypothetical protein